MLMKPIPMVLCLFFTFGCPGPDQHEKSIQVLNQCKAMVKQAEESNNMEKKASLIAVEEILQQAEANDPEFVPLQIERARVLWDVGDQLAGYRLSENIIQRFPTSPDAWVVYGDFQYALSRWNSAVEVFKKAADLGSKDMALFLRIGSAFGKLRDFEAAFDAFDLALENDIPKDVVHFNLGLCYEKTGREDLAVAEYDKSLDENIYYRPPLIRLVRILLKDLKRDDDPAIGWEQTTDFIDRIPISKTDRMKDEANRDKPKNQARIFKMFKPTEIGERIECLILIEEDYSTALKLLRNALENWPGNNKLHKLEKILTRLVFNEENR